MGAGISFLWGREEDNAVVDGVDFTLWLPLEVVHHILRSVDGRDLLSIAAVNRALRCACASPSLWRTMLERKRRQITFVPYAEKEADCAHEPCYEDKHRFFRSSVWPHASCLAEAVALAERSALGGEIHLEPGTYRGLLLEGGRVDMAIVGHGDVVIENTSPWRPCVHICNESALDPAFVREQLASYVASYVPQTVSEHWGQASSYVIPEYLSSLFRSPTLSPTVVIEGVTVLVSSSADTISTFPVYIEGRANVVLHRCTVRGARLSSIVVSKGAVCDVLECGALEDGVFFVSGAGSVRGCRIHDCGMHAVEVRSASRDILVEGNLLSRCASGLHVPWRNEAAADLPSSGWEGSVSFVNNRVSDCRGPSLRVEGCERNPHMGVVSGNVFFGNAEQREMCAKLREALDSGVCTLSVTGNEHEHQPWFECRTCGLDSSHSNKGMCGSCVTTCHAGHDVMQRWVQTKSFCDCGCTPAFNQ